MRAYRHVCRGKAEDVEEHCVVNTAQFRYRFAVSHGTLGERGEKQYAVGVEFFEQLLSDFVALSDVRVTFCERHKAVCRVQGVEIKSLRCVFRISDKRFSQLIPQVLPLLKIKITVG
jgi:hypothetical protein